MAIYSHDVLNEVFAENDIVDYVSQYTPLRKNGRDYSGLCPFHKEKTPSFHVSREKQLFHCFGCGASGNLVQFVMRAEGLDFVESVKLLADRVGIVLPEQNSAVDTEYHERKKKILEMNRAAARFFYNELANSEKGKVALEYFKSRQLSLKTVKTYGLGYAPDEYTALKTHMNELGYNDKELTDAGLVSNRDGRVYDRFRNRVMFPIIDLRGNVIGFGGRIMGKAEEKNGFKIPKYLNSAETPVFNKGKNLFSLNFAKKDNSGKLILVEGYMDVISVYQAGITNVVATLGTALTEDQAKLMMKYCSEILICYDTDEAGQKATVRAIEIINSIGGRAKVIVLKGAKDPDEYIKNNGVELFKKAVMSAIASTEYRLNISKSHFNMDVTDGRVQFVSEAAEILGSVHDAIEVDAYIKKIASETEISKEAIYSEYKKKVKKTQKQTTAKKVPVNNVYKEGQTVVVRNADRTIEKAEKLFLNLISQNRKFALKAKEIINHTDFSNEVYQKLAESIYNAYENNMRIEPALLLNDFSGEELKMASEVFYNMETYHDEEKTFNDLVNTIRLQKIRTQITQEKDPEVLKNLLNEQAILSKNKAIY